MKQSTTGRSRAAAAFSILLLSSAAHADIRALGHEFRPTAAQRGGIDHCTAPDGNTTRVEFVCDAVNSDGTCDSDTGSYFASWRDAAGSLVAGPLLLAKGRRSDLVWSCGRDGSIAVIVDHLIQVIDRNGPRGKPRFVCEHGGNGCSTWTERVTSTLDGFFVAWLGAGVGGRFFDAAGAGISEPFALIDVVPGYDYVEDIATASDEQGNVLVAWASTSRGVLAAHPNADTSVSNVVAVSEFPYGGDYPVSAAAAADGLFTVSWINRALAGWVARQVSLDDSAATTTTTTTTTTLEPEAAGFLPATRLARFVSQDYDAQGLPLVHLDLAADDHGRWVGEWGNVQIAEQGDYFGEVVTISDDDGSHWSGIDTIRGYAEPTSLGSSLATDGGNTWILLSQDEWGGFGQRRSRDGGRTWSAITPLYARPLPEDVEGSGLRSWETSRAGLASDGGRRWIAVWSETLSLDGEYGGPTSVCAIRGTTSVDSGKHWSAATTLATTAYTDGCWRDAPVVATDASGNWLVAGIDGKGRIMGLDSSDGGASWSRPRRLVDSGDLQGSELSLAAGKRGGWVAAFAAGVPDPLMGTKLRIFVSRAATASSAWSAPLPIAPWHDSEGGRDDGPSVASGQDGQWAIAWSTHSAPGGGLDADIVAAFSDDDGVRWSPAQLVNADGRGDVDTDVSPRVARSGSSWGVLWRSVRWPTLGGWDGSLRFARTAGQCGNGRLDPGEQCDDGNDGSGDGCDANCQATGCPNGIVTAGEQCDDGNTDDRDDCLTDCRLPTCGDGAAHLRYEECDDGNSSDADACRNDCTAARCGDGIVAAGIEECDAGELNSTVGACRSDCRLATCGDGFIEAGVEECDDANGNDLDRCTGKCRLNPVCGRHPAGAESRATATAAQRVLKKAVGIALRCPRKTCDLDRDGRITTADALGTLRLAVGLVQSVDECSVIHTVAFRLESGANLSALLFHVDYSAADGDLLGEENAPACDILVPVTHAEYLAGGLGYLNVGMITLDSFSAPVDLMRCEYRGRTAPTPEDFAITIQDATDADGDQIVPQPVVSAVPLP